MNALSSAEISFSRLRTVILLLKTGSLETRGWDVSQPYSDGMKRWTPTLWAASMRRRGISTGMDLEGRTSTIASWPVRAVTRESREL